jgi:hypothetical protein
MSCGADGVVWVADARPVPPSRPGGVGGHTPVSPVPLPRLEI